MRLFDKTIYEFDSEFDHYQVVDTVYKGRPARVLFSGDRLAAQSGKPVDGKAELLFDYNQRFFDLATSFKPRHSLLIGGGSFSLPQALQAVIPDINIDVIERDPTLLPVAVKYFDFEDWPGLRVIEDDGREFIEDTASRYDLIMIDAFSNLTIPRDLVTLEAVQTLKRCLKPGGILAMNVIAAYQGRSAVIVERLDTAYRETFKKYGFFPADSGFSQWQAQNLMLLAHDGSQDLQAFMRYPAMPPLVDNTSFALHDEAL